MNKKKLATSVAAVATAAALLLGGTFAWQSVNQTALNEGADTINPGGRLHDDFDGTNKDVYVENFTDPENGGQDIFARVRLEEYLEVVLNYGTPGQTEKQLLGSKYYAPVLDEDGEQVVDEDGNLVYETAYTYEYVPFTEYSNSGEADAGVEVGADGSETSYWKWKLGGSTVYMPTFNMNKDSRAADVNGEYLHGVGVITDKDIEGGQYSPMETYIDGESKTANEIWDTDSNDIDELAEDGVDIRELIEQTETDYDSKAIKLVSKEHTAKSTLDAKLISMSEWLDKYYNDEDTSNYWVYDTDGWVYWSAPIAPGTATGLLLDGIALNQVMDDTWYYAINVVAQFVTADDAGAGDGTGFYDETKGEAPSWEAEQLLEAIGVTLDGSEDDEEGGFVANPGTLHGIKMSLYADTPNISVDEETNTLTVNPVNNWERADVILEDALLTFADTENTVYMWDESEGRYDLHEDTFVDISCYKDDNMVDIYLSDSAAGKYKIEVFYDDSEGNTFTGSIEFTIEVYDGPGAGESAGDDGEDEKEFFNELIFDHDAYSDVVKGGEMIEFWAAVYDEDGECIAETEDITFTATEVFASEATVLSDGGQTFMGENFLIVADDVIDRGVESIAVSITYVAEDGTHYSGECVFSTKAEENPLKTKLVFSEREVEHLPGDDPVFQVFTHDPSKETYQFSSTLDGAAANVEWGLAADSDYVDYTTTEDESFVYALANGYWVEGWGDLATDQPIAKIHKTTGEFEVLIGYDFPISGTFMITAKTSDGTYERYDFLYIAKRVVEFQLREQGNVSFGDTYYTPGENTEITIEPYILKEGVLIEQTDITEDIVYGWGVYKGEYYSQESEELISDTDYTLVYNRDGTWTLTVLEPVVEDAICIRAYYDYGAPTPHHDDGIHSADLSIYNRNNASTGVPNTMKIYDEYDETESTYTPGGYNKISLNAVLYDINDVEVYNNNIITWTTGSSNVRVIGSGRSAEVQIRGATAETITVSAMYYGSSATNLFAEYTITATAEDAP